MTRVACGIALLGGLWTASGCATHVAPPPIGSPGGPRGSFGSVAGNGAVWRLMRSTSPSISWGGEGTYGYQLIREDSATGRVVAVVDLGKRVNQRVGNLAIGYGAVWMGLTKGSLIKVDASTNAVVAVIRLASGGWWRGHEDIPKVAVGEGAVWALVWGHDDLFRVDPETGKVERIGLMEGLGSPSAVSVGGGTVVVSHPNGDSRVDPRTRALVPAAR